tara:strand:- start:593 stop:1015 length:423 start_codon:yes stop_codon:yes gene_type:complete
MNIYEHAEGLAKTVEQVIQLSGMLPNAVVNTEQEDDTLFIINIKIKNYGAYYIEVQYGDWNIPTMFTYGYYDIEGGGGMLPPEYVEKPYGSVKLGYKSCTDDVIVETVKDLLHSIIDDIVDNGLQSLSEMKEPQDQEDIA